MADNNGIIINGGHVGISNIAVGGNSEINIYDDSEILKPVEKKPKEEVNNISTFISYRRSDSSDVTGRIYDRLLDEFGEEYIFKDVNKIPLGSNFKATIREAIKKTSIVLVVIGRNWVGNVSGTNERRIMNDSDFVRLEILTALEFDKSIIPLFVGGGDMPDKSLLPNDLENITYLNGLKVRPDPDFDNDVDRLISGIKSIV